MSKTSPYKIIQPDQWYRKNQYEFFKDYDDPCFNVTAPVDVTNLYDYCNKHGYSFFLTSLFFAQQSMNAVEELRLRYVDGKIRLYDHIDAGCTILRNDHTFGFGYFDYTEDLSDYLAHGEEVVRRVRAGEDIVARDEHLDLIHCSTLPWISFTAFKHARHTAKNHSIPKLVFGKYYKADGLMLMPVSIEVMHAMVDGYHIGQFYTHLNKLINSL